MVAVSRRWDTAVKGPLLPLADLVGKRVKVYCNLHTQGYSILHRSEGKERVVAHADRLTLTSVEFRVQECGRQRAIEENARNVHAYAIGVLAGAGSESREEVGVRVRYNPFRTRTFVREDGTPVHSALAVHLLDDKRVFAELDLVA